MRHIYLPLAASAAFLLTSPLFAGDVLIRVEGTVISVGGIGSSIAPFSSAQTGDSFVVEYEVFVPGTGDPAALIFNNVPVPSTDYEIDFGASGVIFAGQRFVLEDTIPPPYESGVSLISGVNGVFAQAGAGGGFVTQSVWDFLRPPGQVVTSNDVAALVGTTIDTSVLNQPFLTYSDAFGITGGNEVLIDVSSISFSDPVASIGTSYCGPAVVNSTGNSGEISATGSTVVTNNDVTLEARNLPNNAFGYFLTSRTQGLVPQPGGSLGVLCLGGSIGRYTGAGQIQNSGATGSFDLLLDLTRTPTPTGLVSVAAGETWNFTTWHRDSVGGAAVSNFTNGLSITFQ